VRVAIDLLRVSPILASSDARCGYKFHVFFGMEWYKVDYEYVQVPEVSSQSFTTTNFISPKSSKTALMLALFAYKAQ
jgi:hypothetical protein